MEIWASISASMPSFRDISDRACSLGLYGAGSMKPIRKRRQVGGTRNYNPVLGKVATSCTTSSSPKLTGKMPSELTDLRNVRLDAHPVARSKAVSTALLPQGSVVVSVRALSTVLLPEQKGKRCDACLRLESEMILLRNCSRCQSYWYCGEECKAFLPTFLIFGPSDRLDRSAGTVEGAPQEDMQNI
jgi:hypothetical protein